jgi:hypothetical protein
MAPRAAASRWSASAQGSSSLRARRTLSSWPMTFLVRVTRSSFSREVCDILLVYPRGVWYQSWARIAMTLRTIEQGEFSLQPRHVPRGVHRIVIDRLLPSQGHIPPQQNWNSETNMFRHANGAPSANKLHSPNRSLRRLPLDWLSTGAAFRGVRLTCLNLVARYLEAANEPNLTAGREAVR